jgi:hypothetical protein
MISCIGRSWLSVLPWATASSDHGRPAVRSLRSGRVGLVGRPPVGAPFPARASWCSASLSASRVFPLFRRPLQLWGRPGWVNYRVLWLLWRPFPAWGHGDRGRDRRGCVPRNLLWCRPSHPAHPRTVRPDQSRDEASALIMPESRGWSGLGTGPQPGTARPPGRFLPGRHPTAPRRVPRNAEGSPCTPSRHGTHRRPCAPTPRDVHGHPAGFRGTRESSRFRGCSSRLAG